MKRTWIGIALLLVVLISGIAVTWCFGQMYPPLAGQLEQARTAAETGDWETAEALTLQAQRDWLRLRHFTAAVADHEPLEEIDCLFDSLLSLQRQRQGDEFSAECAHLARLCQTISDSQAITWWNLL